ncbi:hypothetical protein [Ramlibacter sp. PS4R-6]|uniref:hypothetical protein n=1 Tax=Ramlibacter sp. PS4R-6 TaxID=3133438 RepID=UPI0030A12CE1
MRSWYPGYLPLAAGGTVSLEPRDCGVLKVGRGKLSVADRLLGPGEELNLWRGEAVQVVNVAHRTTAFFAWDACPQQPTLRQRARRALARLGRFVKGNRHAQLASCGSGSWCVRA